MLSERIALLYAYGTNHTRMVIPYAYGIQNYTIRVRYIPYKIRVWYRTSSLRVLVTLIYATAAYHDRLEIISARFILVWPQQTIHMCLSQHKLAMFSYL